MDKPVVLACDHAVPALARHGVRPDLVFAVDGAGYVYPDEFPDVPLLAAASADPALTFAWRGAVAFWVHAALSMRAFTDSAWRDPELVIDNARTVGGTLLSLALKEFPSVRRLHLFGYDYSWEIGGPEHAADATFRTHYAMPVLEANDHTGKRCHTNHGFVLEAQRALSRIEEWSRATEGWCYMHGRSILPIRIRLMPDADRPKDGGVEADPILGPDIEAQLTRNSVSRFGARWRGSARANALFPNPVPPCVLLDDLRTRVGEDLVLVGAGPSADETLPRFDALIEAVRASVPILAIR